VSAARRGHVALVGAGPGDPALLTLRAAELIRCAEVVAYDELVSEAVLAMVPGDVELLAVGRRVGAGALAHRLHPEVKARALAGRRVVRLKAGDPLIFGRGGEEAEELRDAGIDFEIVPGITAAVGAAASLGAPLTHRERAAELVFASGHRVDDTVGPGGGRLGRTLALYMAAHQLVGSLAAIAARGWPATTPALLVAAATTIDEEVVRGTLATLAARSQERGVPRSGHAALVLVGALASDDGSVGWRHALALRGRQLVVARARLGPSDLARRLRDLGACVIELPHLRARARTSAVDAAAPAAELALLGSAEAVAAWLALAAPPPPLALGAEAIALLAAAGVTPVAALRGSCSEALTEVASLLRGRTVLVPAAPAAGQRLAATIAQLGGQAQPVVLAEHAAAAPARWPTRVDLVILPSSLAARALYAFAPPALLRAPALAIGPRTAAQALRSGVTRLRQTAEDSVDALIAGALDLLAARPGGVPSHPAAPSLSSLASSPRIEGEAAPPSSPAAQERR
jgi:uroporphyrinogen III methyltransferase / synthase